MTKAEQLTLLREWRAWYRRQDAAWEALEKALGAPLHGSELWEATWGLFDRYQQLVARQLPGNFRDNAQWLEWFCFENDMGRKGMEAGPSEGPLRKIKSLEDLRWVMQLGIKGK